jgi:phage terminase large subunit GpA-like protein
MTTQMPNKLLRSIVDQVRRSVAPPPLMTVSQWSDAYRIVARSARPGLWSTDYTPYLREPMDAYTDDRIEVICLMFGVQLGKSAMIENMMGYSVDADPSPMFMVHPDDNSISDFSQEKLMPMISETPRLKALVKLPKPGQSGSTERKKSFPGGYIGLVSANSPASLRARSVRRIFFDEADAYPTSSKGEGDPILLGQKRTSSYPNRKIVITSTPTNQGRSRVEKSFLRGDQRRWYVPCKDPECGVREPFKWSNIKWSKDADGEPLAATACYVCEHCGTVHTDADKVAMNAGGLWVPTAKPKDIKVRSYHLSEIASPWRTFEEIVRSFLEAKDSVELLRAWTNTTLGETWKDRSEQVDWEILQKRAEPYPVLRAPRGVRIITAGVDVQHNRLAVSIWGYGRREESWLLFHTEIFGDVDQPEVWEELDDLRRRTIPSERGKDLIVMACAVDSSDGAKMNAVYNYCRGKRPQGVFPIKGSSIATSPVIGTGSKQDVDWKGKKYAHGVEMYIVGGHIIRSTLYARMANAVAGSAGYVHFPTAISEDYFKQLCADKYVTTVSKGLPVSKWVTDGRNEAIDCAVYAYAAAYLAGLPSANWDKLDKLVDPEGYEEAQKLALETDSTDTPTTTEPGAPVPEPKPPTPPVRKGPRVIKSGWNTGWKT